MKRYALCFAMALGLLASCNGDSSSSPTSTSNRFKFSQINIVGNSSEPINLNDTLSYKAMGTESAGSAPIDITAKVSWEAPKTQLKATAPGVFTAIKPGQAAIHITYLNSNNSISESTIIINITATIAPNNYTILTIGGDVAKESAESGETLTYTATGIDANNGNREDLTNQVTWQTTPNAPLKLIQPGVFNVLHGAGSYTIFAKYASNNLESSHTITVINQHVTFTHIVTYPKGTVYLNHVVNESSRYQLQAKGVDANNKEYSLNPELLKWSVSPENSGATIDQTTGELQVTSDNNFTVTASYNNNLESTVAVAVSSSPSLVVEHPLDSNTIIGTPNQIFYISRNSLVKSCPVSSVDTIDSAKSRNTVESNYTASSRDCTFYKIPVSIKGTLSYNEKYNKIYTFAAESNIIYSINALSHQVESFTANISTHIDDLVSSDASNITLLSSNITDGKLVNQIAKCTLDTDGALLEDSCDQNSNSAIDLTVGANLNNSYLLKTSNHWLIFNSIEKQPGKNALIITRCSIDLANCTKVIDSTQSNSPYYNYADILISRPSLLANSNEKSYIYSVALATANNDTYTPNTFTINNTSGTITINESTVNVLGAPNYVNGADIRTYNKISLDSQNKWAYYGTNSSANALQKCSYASDENSSNGVITGSCHYATNFTDSFIGATFVPGKNINSISSRANNLFFISEAFGNRIHNKVYMLVQCSKNANESITEASCYKYSLPELSANSKIVHNNSLNKVYIVNGSDLIYMINPNSHELKAFETSVLNINGIVFSSNGVKAYLASSNEETGATSITSCQVTLAGAITRNCSTVRAIMNQPHDELKLNDMSSYNKYLYVMLNNMIYKCDLLASNLDITDCKLMSLINPHDNTEFNTKKVFLQFSGVHHNALAKSFLYLSVLDNISSIWPALIDNNTGSLTLNPVTSYLATDLSWMSNGLHGIMGKLNFDDSNKFAYLGFPSTKSLLTCPYDETITLTGTVNVHGDTTSCTAISNFKPFETLQLLDTSN